MTFQFVGTISHGTLITKDLILSFYDVLRVLDRNLSEKYRRQMLCLDDTSYDYLGDILNNLFDDLDSCAPDLMYFGAHEGDGSDFGFWLNQAAIDDAVHNKELLQVSDLADIPSGWSNTVLLVNDHGNTTLYEPRIEWDEVAGYV